MVAVECKVCGNIFGVYADEASIKKFCSKCYNKLRAKREENMDNTIKVKVTDVTEDVIGHPNHYCAGRKYEPKDVIRDWDLNFNLGNAVKYISRNGRKSGESSLKDLKKARQYLDFEIEAIEKEEK